MKMRKAAKEDYKRCAELDRSIFGTDKRKEFLRLRIQAKRMYVAECDNRIVGFATFETDFIGCLFVSLLLVHPDFRRRGIARKLIEKVASHSKNGRLFSSTEEDNEVSIKMHEALGFRRSGHVDNLPQQARELIYFKELA